MGSNMAENHPVAFRWPMKAKVEHGAKMIHVDPRFTRTSAVADIYAPVRAGSDIAFLGGIIKYVINSERWNKDPFFKSFVVNYTNARDDHQRGLQGHRRTGRSLFGTAAIQGGGRRMAVQRFDRSVRRRELAVRRTKVGAGEAAAATARVRRDERQHRSHRARAPQLRRPPPRHRGPPFAPLVRLVKPAPAR